MNCDRRLVTGAAVQGIRDRRESAALGPCTRAARLRSRGLVLAPEGLCLDREHRRSLFNNCDCITGNPKLPRKAILG